MIVMKGNLPNIGPEFECPVTRMSNSLPIVEVKCKTYPVIRVKTILHTISYLINMSCIINRLKVNRRV